MEIREAIAKRLKDIGALKDGVGIERTLLINLRGYVDKILESCAH